YRRGYPRAAIDVFPAIDRLLDPASRRILRDWSAKGIYVWTTRRMLGYPRPGGAHAYAARGAASRKRPHGTPPHVHAAGRRDDVAARGSRAAAGSAGDWIPQYSRVERFEPCRAPIP